MAAAVVTSTVPTRPHRTADGAAVLLPDDPDGQVQQFLTGATPHLGSEATITDAVVHGTC